MATARLYWTKSEGGWLLDRVVDERADFPAVYARKNASLETLARAVAKVDPALEDGEIEVLGHDGQSIARLLVKGGVAQVVRPVGVQYRYECKCGARGRWLKDGNAACSAGERHYDRAGCGETPEVVDTTGKNHGSAV